MTQAPTPKLIVGVGASAGGLAALQALLEYCRAGAPMAFIIVQHMEPNHKSQLSELLANVTSMRVKEVQNGESITAGNVYVTPPNRYITVVENHLHLAAPKEDQRVRYGIDHLFKTLAKQCGKYCAGIVLSGTGHDGTEGLRAIREAGGLTIAQTPETAAHMGMPSSAIEAELVDEVAGPEHIFSQLKAFINDNFEHHTITEASSANDNQTLVQEVAKILYERENFKLSQYKNATVRRRIARRMSLTCTSSVSHYLQLVADDAQERRLLMEDILINVTDFFRDPQAFQSLEASVIDRILQSLDEDEEIRIWVAGCATGEEAYSIAMLASEAISQAGKTQTIKIFATDLDEQALSIGRKGVYPNDIAERIPATYLDKYFIYLEQDDRYRVKPEIRSLISFAVQNVISDPPFGHVHLISCRNLLIYLTRNVQDRVISSFYFALKPDGYLFLGTSETIGEKKELFKTISKKWRIFQKKNSSQKRQALWDSKATLSSQTSHTPLKTKRQQNRDTVSRSEVLRRSLMETFLPPAVVVDRDGLILYNHGDWGPYINISSGEPTHNIVQLVAAPLRSKIRSALFKATKTGEMVTFRAHIDKDSQSKIQVRVDVSVLANSDFPDTEVLGVIFRREQLQAEDQTFLGSISNDDETKARHNIERELAETREELQNTIEELETSTEELKASHEEALSTNEELQSANEELEASSTELRILNDELNSVNLQLEEKIAQLQKANDDVKNFFASTDLPTLFLNPRLKIERYTFAAEQLLKMGPADVGRKITSLGRDLIDEQLEIDCKLVLRNFHSIRTEITTDEGLCYIRQVTPYRTADRKVDGVVIVFQDVSELKRLSERAGNREQQQAVVAKLGMLALSGKDPQTLIRQVVREVTYTLKADYGKVMRYREDSQDFLLEEGIGWEKGLVGQLVVPGGTESQAGYTMMSKDPIITLNLAEEKRFQSSELLIDHEVVSGISCVINHTAPAYGVLSVHTTALREFSQDDANFLQSICNMLSAALRMQRSQEKILESEQQFRSVANSIPQLAWMTDETGYIHWYNERWYKFTGSKAAEMEGWGWQKVHHPDHLSRVLKHFKQAITDKSSWEDEFPIKRYDGEYRWFLSRAEPIKNLQGEVVAWFGTNTDITEQRQQADALRDSENKLRLAMNTNKIGFFEYSLQQEETYWDDMIKSIWGINEGEIPSQDIFRMGVHPEDLEMVLKELERASMPSSNGIYHCIYRVVNLKNKNISWVEASGQVLFEQLTPIKMVGLVLDITDRKHLEESLKQAVKELQAADQSKNEFLSILGHELRNPLAALAGSVDIMLTEEPEQQKILQVMQHSVTTMSKLLDDLLDLNRVSQNKVQLNLFRVDLAEILKNTIAVTSNACSKKQQFLMSDVDYHCWVAGDSARLEQIFSNLILNASRYTPEGGTINLTLRITEDHAVVSIKDTGVGISAKHLERIFDPFFQIKQDKQAASGLGIGLALSKKLVALHQGDIRATSEGLDQGSTFVVRLPLHIGDEIPEKEAARELMPIRSGLRVLVVEDNENLLATVPLLLEHLGCEVETAATGHEGLRKTWTFKPEAMLVDIGLPDISGHQVAELLRRDGYKGLLIAVSGYSHTEIKQKSKISGFDFHLAKPVTLAEITELLAACTQKELHE